MPAKKKRIKPVIEEVVEEKADEKPAAEEEKKEVEEAATEPAETVTEPEPASTGEAAVEEAPPPQPKHGKMNLKLIVVITLISALVAAFVSGGVYVYLSGLESLDDEPTTEAVAEPTSTPTAAPEATPEAEEVDISEYSVQVLNGSGEIGAASGGEDVLTEAGFSVGSTGNAGRYDYEATEVQAKGDVPEAVMSSVQEALEDADYEVEIGDELDGDSEYDIVVIVGAS